VSRRIVKSDAANQNDGIFMSTSTQSTAIEPWGRTYLRGAAFSIPALLVLAFSSVYLFPKLETLWRDARFGASSATITAVQTAYFVTQHFFIITATIAGTLVLLEWRSSRWPQYRRVSVSVAAFLVNTAILVFITVMFMTALMAAPALLAMK
jgi:hypothetical protein